MAMASYWSVERDGGSVLATCPEALRSGSDSRPEWMGHCAAALRDELRLVEIEAGTLLQATLIGAPPPGADLENVLLYNVNVPDAHVHTGVRLRWLPPSGDSVVQRYERVPIAAVENEVGDPPLAAVRVPVIDGLEVETARHVWLAARTVVAAELPAGVEAPPGGIDLRIRFTVESTRRRGTIDLVKKLLDGVCAAFQSYAGANLDEVARRLALELGTGAEAMRALAASPRGALLGAHDCFWLRGEGVGVTPAGDRIHAAEITLVTGPVPQLEIELREIASG
jgi:hypothetical protein